jgi:HK97 gp10 family phage protein
MVTWTPDGKNRMFRIEGMEELEAKLSELMDANRADSAARATIVKAAKEAMIPVADQVKATAPYDPSPRTKKSPIHLRDTVRLDARIPTRRDQQSIYVNPTDAAIAVVSVKRSAVSLAQEFGTKKIPAQPFLRRAIEQNAETVVNNFKTSFAEYLASYANKMSRRRK